MKKKKIAICLRDMQVGGAEAVCIRMLDALLRQDKYEFVLITYVDLHEKMYLDWFRAHPEIKRIALYPSRFFGTRLAHFLPLRLIQHACRSLYRGYRRMRVNDKTFADIDLFVDFYDFGFEREFRKLNKPKIAWWHSSINKFLGGDYIARMNTYDKLVMLTDGATNELCDRYPDMAGRVVRIYNPIDIDDIRARTDAAPTPIYGEYFCAVARLSRDKDIATILYAFDAFWRGAGRPDIKMVFVGDGDRADEYKSIAASLAAANQFVFAGAQSNPFIYMRGARAHILSSHGEGLGLVVIEALAAGCLNIASDCQNGPREILLDGKIGLLFAPGDVDALARAMSDAWTGRNTKISSANVRRSLARFDGDNVARDIMRLFDGMMK